MTKYVHTGNAIFAKQMIYAGETILEEEPLISCQYLWNKEYKYDSCEFCLKPLETAEENARRLAMDPSITLPYLEQCCLTDKSKQVACMNGCLNRYCSQECFNRAWQTYHRTLCPREPSNSPQLSSQLERLCTIWKSIHYPPETTSIMLLVKILASIKQSPNSVQLIQELDQFLSRHRADSERLANKLLGDKFREHLNTLKQIIAEMMFENKLESFFTENGFISLIAMISRNGQGIGTSPFSKWAENCEILVANNQNECLRINQLIEDTFTKMDEASGPFLNNEGSGLYRLQSAINHSCEPNAEVQFSYNNHILSVKATQDINPNEEILICFLDECMRSRSRHSRIKYLQENYLFNCNCAKCQLQINDPDITSDEDDEDSNDSEEMNCD